MMSQCKQEYEWGDYRIIWWEGVEDQVDLEDIGEDSNGDSVTLAYGSQEICSKVYDAAVMMLEFVGERREVCLELDGAELDKIAKFVDRHCTPEQ